MMAKGDFRRLSFWVPLAYFYGGQAFSEGKIGRIWWTSNLGIQRLLLSDLNFWNKNYPNVN